MIFTLTINTGNSAFGDDESDEQARAGDVSPERARETARILREIAKRIEEGDITTYMRTVYDANGNDVGRAAFKAN